jgi:hypothetical protein
VDAAALSAGLGDAGSLLRAVVLAGGRGDGGGMNNHTDKTQDDNTTEGHAHETEHAAPTSFDGPDDNTVENSEEMGGGYGGPAPVNPEDEQA